MKFKRNVPATYEDDKIDTEKDIFRHQVHFVFVRSRKSHGGAVDAGLRRKL